MLNLDFRLGNSGSTVSSMGVNPSPKLLFIYNTAIAPISFKICGLNGKIIKYEITGPIAGDGCNGILTLTDEIQEVVFAPVIGGIYTVNLTGDIDAISDLLLYDNIGLICLEINNIASLETVIANNCALPVSAIDGLIKNLTSVTDFPHLTMLGLHGQTPVSPPTLSILNAFKSVRGLAFNINTDVQPYNVKVRTGTNTTEGKTASVRLSGNAGKTINIDWGPNNGLNTQTVILTGNFQDITHLYAQINTDFLLRFTGDIDAVHYFGNSPEHADKIKEFNPKNFIGLDTIRLQGTKLNQDATTFLAQSLMDKSNFPALASFVEAQTPLTIFPYYEFIEARKDTSYFNLPPFMFGPGANLEFNPLTVSIKAAELSGGEYIDFGEDGIVLIDSTNEITFTHFYRHSLLFNPIINIYLNSKIKIENCAGLLFMPILAYEYISYKGCNISSDECQSVLDTAWTDIENYPCLFYLNLSGMVTPFLITQETFDYYQQIRPTATLILDIEPT